MGEVLPTGGGIPAPLKERADTTELCSAPPREFLNRHVDCFSALLLSTREFPQGDVLFLSARVQVVTSLFRSVKGKPLQNCSYLLELWRKVVTSALLP